MSKYHRARILAFSVTLLIIIALTAAAVSYSRITHTMSGSDTDVFFMSLRQNQICFSLLNQNFSLDIPRFLNENRFYDSLRAVMPPFLTDLALTLKYASNAVVTWLFGLFQG